LAFEGEFPKAQPPAQGILVPVALAVGCSGSAVRCWMLDVGCWRFLKHGRGG
jgi:hypothetical protein